MSSSGRPPARATARATARLLRRRALVVEHVDWYGRRPLAISLALVGLALSVYLGLFQAGFTGHEWEPLFGSGSITVLRTRLTGGGPLPVGALGVIGFLGEMVLAWVALRPGRPQLAALLFGLLGVGLGVAGVVLVAVQAFVIHAWCTLCLLSDAVALSLALLGLAEIRRLVVGPERSVARRLVAVESSPFAEVALATPGRSETDEETPRNRGGESGAAS